MSSKASGSDNVVRRRLHVLERAQSLSSLKKKSSDFPKILPLEIKHKSRDDQPPSSATDDDTQSESSEEDKEHSGNGTEEGEDDVLKRSSSSPPPRPTVQTRNLRRRSAQRDRSPMSPRSRAWYEFDLAVVVALVSPIGNWLTGGDHIKHLLLIALLIFYLHQIIEIPWTLYQKARPRNKAFHLPAIDPDSQESRYAALAASELQKWEILYLILAFLSPFLGAGLLRYVTAAILGPDAISWFSAGLFVLATGVRPWSQLIDRLTKRTEELHDFIHYPPTHRCATEDHQTQLEDRFVKLEKTVNKLKTKMSNVTEDIYDYVEDTVEAMEHAMLNQERKFDKYQGKVRDVETAVGQLQSWTVYRYLPATFRVYLHSVQEYVFSVLPFAPKGRYSIARSPLGPVRSASSSQLETILEEENSFETDVDKYPVLARPYSLTSSLVYRIGSLAILPLRAVGRMVLGTY